jgi:hypothetical protein
MIAFESGFKYPFGKASKLTAYVFAVSNQKAMKCILPHRKVNGSTDIYG